MAQNVAGAMADKQHETETEFVQLHTQGTQRYTPEEISSWPNKTIVYISARYNGPDDWSKTVLPHVQTQLVLILSNGDPSPPEDVVHTLLASGKVLLIFGINMPYLLPRVYHWPLGLNNGDRYSGNETLMGEWYDRSYSRGPEHLRTLFESKKQRFFMPKLGHTHSLRPEVEKWLKSSAMGTELVDYHEDLGIGNDFAKYMRTMSEYKFCLCPRGGGIDIHRAWECLVVGSIPVYVSNDRFPGAFRAIQAERYMANLTTLPQMLQRTAHLKSYIHTTFLWHAREFVLSDYHNNMMRLMIDNL